jgi:hypothetical protein
MSNKTQLQTNNTALDGYIARINAAKDIAASLPEAGGGSGCGVISVNVNNTSGMPVYYWDETGTQQSVNSSSTVSALNGVLYTRQVTLVSCVGDYLEGMVGGVVVVTFLSDGGTLNSEAGIGNE